MEALSKHPHLSTIDVDADRGVFSFDPSVLSEGIPASVDVDGNVSYVTPDSPLHHAILFAIAGSESYDFSMRGAVYRVVRRGDDLWQKNVATGYERPITLSPVQRMVEEWNKEYNERNAFKTKTGLEIEISLPSAFPEEPPFVRIVSPRIVQHTGHITIGGSFCSQLLTNGSGAGYWDKLISASSLVEHLVTGLMNNGDLNGTEGSGGRFTAVKIDTWNLIEYTHKEARDASVNAIRFHESNGW